MSLRARFILLAVVLCGALAGLVALSSVHLRNLLEEQLHAMGKEAAQEGAATVTQYLERFKTLALGTGAMVRHLWETEAFQSARELRPAAVSGCGQCLYGAGVRRHLRRG